MVAVEVAEMVEGLEVLAEVLEVVEVLRVPAPLVLVFEQQYLQARVTYLKFLGPMLEPLNQ